MADNFAVIYRWQLNPGMERQFQDGWHRVTVAILDRCGSFGSRLHRCEDGTWLAYARWPSAEARSRCFEGEPVDAEASRLMREAIAYEDDDLLMAVVDDLLSEP